MIILQNWCTLPDVSKNVPGLLALGPWHMLINYKANVGKSGH